MIASSLRILITLGELSMRIYRVYIKFLFYNYKFSNRINDRHRFSKS